MGLYVRVGATDWLFSVRIVLVHTCTAAARAAWAVPCEHSIRIEGLPLSNDYILASPASSRNNGLQEAVDVYTTDKVLVLVVSITVKLRVCDAAAVAAMYELHMAGEVGAARETTSGTLA
jgi:hypothetical protein